MIDLGVFKQISAENEDKLPLLTLDEFFSGDPKEDSIAPNRWGYGRPSLAELWEMLRKVEMLPNVAWVRVALHHDTQIITDNGTEVLDLAGDSIVVCTDMGPDGLEEVVDLDWSCSDGVIRFDPALYHSRIPPIPPNHDCWEIVWD